MFDMVLVGVLGILLGLSAGMAAQLWIELKRVKVLKETLQNDWNLRQIEGAVRLPRSYDQNVWLHQQQKALPNTLGPYYGDASGGSTINTI